MSKLYQIGERFSVENMKRLTEEAILREEDELKRHELSLKRLRLTRRDIDDIEMSLDKCLSSHIFQMTNKIQQNIKHRSLCPKE